MRLTHSLLTWFEAMPQERRDASTDKADAINPEPEEWPRWVSVGIGLIVIVSTYILVLLAFSSLCW